MLFMFVFLCTSLLIMLDQGMFIDAEPLYQECLRLRTKVLGASHPETLGTMNDLAILFER